MSTQHCSPSDGSAIVTAAIETCLSHWRGHKSFAWAGDCGIFADHAYHEARNSGVEPAFDSFNDALDSISSVEMPPGTTRAELEKLAAFQGLNHVWLVHEGLHYDAASPQGVKDPSQLNSFRLCLVYRLRRTAPDTLSDLCASHDWWRVSAQLAAEFDKVYAERDAFYEEN